MATGEKELEQELAETGNKLLDPPSVDGLLDLLHKLEVILLKVDQSPPKSMHDALAPSQKALVADKIFKHVDGDVRVAVAACINEITRITAPEAPYEDEQMKEVFQLIVESFEGLADKSSRSYSKRVSILETVAKVRSCVVMLDLECEGLIIEMFQLLLKAIRDDHSPVVFQNMTTVMTLVLEESEDISVELLSPLLDSVKKGNEDVRPIRRRLAENVLEKCASKVKPYLTNAVESQGASVDDYNDIVGTICQELNGTIEQSDDAEEAKVEDKLVGSASASEAPKSEGDMVVEETSEQPDPGNAKSPEDKSVMTNGVSQTEEDDSLAVSSKKQEDVSSTDVLDNNESSVQPETLDTEKAVDIDNKDENVPNEQQNDSSMKFADQSGPPLEDKKEEQAPNEDHNDSSTKVTDQSGPFTEDKKEEQAPKDQQNDSSTISTDQSGPPNEEKEEEEKLHVEKPQIEDIPNSPSKDLSGEVHESSENQKEKCKQSSPVKTLENEQVSVPCPSVTESFPDKTSLKEDEQLKRDETLTKDAAPSDADIPDKATKEVSALETKITQKQRSKRKGNVGSSAEHKTPTVVETSKKESVTSDLEEKPLKDKSKKKEKGSKTEDNLEERSLKDSSKKKEKGSKAEDNLEERSLKDSSKKKEKSGKTEDDLEEKSLKDPPKKKDKGSKTEDDLGEKPLKDSLKKKEKGSKVEDESSLQRSDDKKKSNREKTVEKHMVHGSTGDGNKEKDSSSKMTEKIKSNEVRPEETPKTSSKRKRVQEEEKKASTKEDPEDLIGLKVKVWWPKDRTFYEGVIESFDPVKKKHKVSYTDGDVEILNLKKERWEIVPDEPEQAEDEEADQAIVETSSDVPAKKKGKSGSSQPTKEAMSSKSKSKSASTKKPGSKSKDTPKALGKFVDDAKSSGKKDDGGKSKDQAVKGGSTPAGGAPKTGSKAKTDEIVSSKAKVKEVGSSTSKFGKLKQETPKSGKLKPQQTPRTSAGTKLKAAKGGSKSNANASGKSDANVSVDSTKEKETEDMESSSESTGGEEPEITKGKSTATSKKRPGSEVKAGGKKHRKEA